MTLTFGIEIYNDEFENNSFKIKDLELNEFWERWRYFANAILKNCLYWHCQSGLRYK